MFGTQPAETQILKSFLEVISLESCLSNTQIKAVAGETLKSKESNKQLKRRSA